MKQSCGVGNIVTLSQRNRYCIIPFKQSTVHNVQTSELRKEEEFKNRSVDHRTFSFFFLFFSFAFSFHVLKGFFRSRTEYPNRFSGLRYFQFHLYLPSKSLVNAPEIKLEPGLARALGLEVVVGARTFINTNICIGCKYWQVAVSQGLFFWLFTPSFRIFILHSDLAVTSSGCPNWPLQLNS